MVTEKIMKIILDCGCCIKNDGSREWCPTCSSEGSSRVSCQCGGEGYPGITYDLETAKAELRRSKESEVSLHRERDTLKAELAFSTSLAKAWHAVFGCCLDLGHSASRNGETGLMGVCRFIREAVEQCATATERAEKAEKRSVAFAAFAGTKVVERDACESDREALEILRQKQTQRADKAERQVESVLRIQKENYGDGYGIHTALARWAEQVQKERTT